MYISDGPDVVAIMDVFEAFLSTDNHVVFAHAALNCVMCLIKYIKVDILDAAASL